MDHLKLSRECFDQGFRIEKLIYLAGIGDNPPTVN